MVVWLGLWREFAVGKKMFCTSYCVEYRKRRRMDGGAYVDYGVKMIEMGGLGGER